MAVSDSIRRACNFKDLTGQRFGRWLVLRESPRAGIRKTFWLCRCECGLERGVRSEMLLAGRSRGCHSCNVTHGLSNRPEYGAWRVMRQRCRNPNAEGYHRYGGRGIRVCARWDNFALFFEDMGPRPSPKHSIDRIDVNGDYTPQNCRWATKKVQQRNTRANFLLTHNGETRCLSEWAELVGINRGTLCHRVLRGWDAERALYAPLRR